MTHVAVYITGHGFGHTARMGVVLEALADRIRDLRLTVVSATPERLVRAHLSRPFAHRSRALDVGVIQRDHARTDIEATLDAVARLLAEQPDRLREEAAFLREHGVDLVLADIPPAAFPAARAAGVPAVGISNFTWDWIYADYVRRFPGYAVVRDAIRVDYAQADLLLRLPFHGPCDAFPVIRDIPMVARRARGDPGELRRRLGVPEARRVVLLSFGGCDIQGIDFDQVERLDEMQFLTTHPMPRAMRNVRRVTLTGFHHVDLVAQADAVITKPGYGIVSECLANRIPVLYTSREGFAEYAPLVDGLNRFGVARFIENADLLAGRWRDALEGLWEQPRTWPELPGDGARVAAEILEGILTRA